MLKEEEKVDDETLKGRFLFPGIACDKSFWERVLLYHMVSYSRPVTYWDESQVMLFKMRTSLFQLRQALHMADFQMAGDKGLTVKLDRENLLFFLTLNLQLQRIDGRMVNYCKEIQRKKKCIMACVLSVPDSCNSHAWDVANIAAELYEQRKDEDDFECVIFLTERCGGWEDYASLEDFLKPFHPSCIIVLLDSSSRYYESNRVVVIDQKESCLFCGYLESLACVGSAAFPFKESHVRELEEQCYHLNHSSLESLLGVEPSHKLFRKIPGTDPDHDPLEEEWRCISEFGSSNKIVFLYTYHHGNHLALLCDTVRGLREKGITEFEIITAYVPVCEYGNPLPFLEVFSSLVAKHGLSPWWVVPYHSSTYHRLMPLYFVNTDSDNLIVFDPKLDYGGDPHGLQVLSYGQSMFPFTKKALVEYVVKELRQVTLQCLFETVTHLRKEEPSTDICKEDPEYDVNLFKHKKSSKSSVLDGKDVLVYFDWFAGDSVPMDKLVSWYNSLGEKRRDDFQVVCVYLDTPQNKYYNVNLRRHIPKWLISSDEEEKACAKYAVDNILFKLFRCQLSTVVAFGKDGKIRSLCAHRVLSSSSSDEAVTFPPFDNDDNLEEEIFNIFNRYFAKLVASERVTGI